MPLDILTALIIGIIQIVLALLALWQRRAIIYQVTLGKSPSLERIL